MAAHGETKEWFGFLNAQYVWVWVALLVLTIIEVIIPEPQTFYLPFDFPRTFQIVSLIGLALAKTWCVAWYYMHLVSEKPAIILIACAPFLFSVFLTIGLFPWEF